MNHINTCGGEFSYKPVQNARESLSLLKKKHPESPFCRRVPFGELT